MIEPLLWVIMCAAAVAMCWSKVRSGAPFSALVFAVFGLIFGVSAWNAFEFLLDAMEIYSAGGELPPFRVSLLVGGPLAFILGKPLIVPIIAPLWEQIPWIR